MKKDKYIDMYFKAISNLENLASHIHWFNLSKSYKQINQIIKQFGLKAYQLHDKYALYIYKFYQHASGMNHYFYIGKHKLYIIFHFHQQSPIIYKAHKDNLLILINQLKYLIQDTFADKYVSLNTKTKSKIENN